MNHTLNFHSNGKLLLSAEYLVLLGAEALAIPTGRGQALKVTQIASDRNAWKTTVLGEQVYHGEFDQLGNFKSSTGLNFSRNLEQIFKHILASQGTDLFSGTSYLFESNLEFPIDWGLGSSSSLISNLSSWSGADAFDLQRTVFKGSGYDVACAMASKPIIYQLEGDKPHWEEIDFLPEFKDELFFIHLNRKQNSRDGISLLSENKHKVNDQLLQRTTDLTRSISRSATISEFNEFITEHEALIGQLLNTKPVKERLFSDFKGGIKSLGAWGGDFVLVTGKENDMEYFKKKGYNTVISFDKMIHQP